MTREAQALAAWGGALPDWVRALAQAVDAGQSQAALARSIDYSPPTVSQVLNNAYRGNLDAVEARVRAVLMSGHVACPVLGDISGEVCLENQRRPFSAGSGARVRLWRACRACAHNLQSQGGGR